MMKKFAFIAGVLMLAACQPDTKPVTTAGAPVYETLPPSTNDVRELFQYFMDRLMARQAAESGVASGTRAIVSLPKDRPIKQEGESTLPNLLRIDAKSGGEPLRLVKRMPVKLGGDTLHGAGIEGAGYSGDITLIIAYPYVSRTLGDIILDYKKPPRPGDVQFRRGNIEVSYRFSQSDQKLNCFTFVENGLAAGLKGDICAPAGKTISKPQAEAIIKGIGADSFMPIEPAADLAALPVS